MAILLIKGNDEVLLASGVKEHVDALVGNGDASLMVEELTEAQYLLEDETFSCLLYTSPSPRDQRGSRMPSSA